MPRTLDRSTKTQAAVGLKAFFNIAEKWQLNTVEQMSLLGFDNESTYFNWKKHPERANVSRDTMERISYVLGIYKDLEILFTDAASADTWVKAENKAPLFGGRSALAFMCQGKVSDLYKVRNYLALQRGV